MKKTALYILIVLLVAIALLYIKTSLEKPKILYKESLDNNTIGILDDSNKGFLLDRGNKTGILLVHGLAASPYQTKDLANFLAERNITVYSIRLSGHGTNLYDMEESSWKDWSKDVEAGYNLLKNKTDYVSALGISSGASLILNLAKENQLDGIIVVAPPIYLKNNKAKYAFIIKYFKRYTYVGVNNTQIGHAYENLPIKSLAEFVDLAETSSKNLEMIDDPILIIQSNKDDLVLPESAKYVFEHVSSEKKEILWVESIKHAVIRPYEEDTKESIEERQKIFNKIYDFLIT